MELVPIDCQSRSNQHLLALLDTIKQDKKSQQQRQELFPKLTDPKHKKINYPIKDNKKPFINFEQLEWVTNLDKNFEDKDQAHDYFMKNYKNILKTDDQIKENIKKEPPNYLRASISLSKPKIDHSKQKLLAITEGAKSEGQEEENLTSRDQSEQTTDQAQKSTVGHDIGVYIKQIHNKKEEIFDPELRRLQDCKRLRKLVKKYPFERNEEENKQINKILTSFPEYLNLFPPSIRNNVTIQEKLAAQAVYEKVISQSTPIFGHLGFYIVLKGHVSPLSFPHLNQHNIRLSSQTPETFNPPPLTEGSCFGTIQELKGREITTRMLRVLTCEDNCEFLKISIESYDRVTKKILEEEKINKLNAIKSCASYTNWPRHLLDELITVFEWREFSANTILTSEGYRSPFIGFINEGECHVLRRLDATHTNPNTGEREKRMRQVVVGKLNKNESFGEISVALKEPMSCSIVTQVPCRIGIIPCDKITKLDNITVRLLLQTSSRTFGDLTQEEIYKKYVDQEKKKEWKEFKRFVVENVIDKYGIESGVGKYATNNLDNVSNNNNAEITTSRKN